MNENLEDHANQIKIFLAKKLKFKSKSDQLCFAGTCTLKKSLMIV